MDKMSDTFRSLTFQGNFGEQIREPNVETGIPDHHCIDSQGLAALAPNAFEFNMPWHLWDIAILHELSMTNLVKLKVPLGVPSDCLQLGCTLRYISNLKSLTITDIPDQTQFLEKLPYLGLGILSRGASLKELGLQITNYNRPNYYCNTFERVTIEDEAFIKPDSTDWFFSWLFPRLPLPGDDDDVDDEQIYLNFRESIFRAQDSPIKHLRPLKLKRIHFRHLDLPSYSFEEIFDSQYLKELSLQFCDVDEEVWPTIKSTSLVKIENIDYDLLSEKFQRLLSTQKSLESVCFARPADECISSDLVLYPGHDSPTMYLQVSKRTPMLGQGTVWGRNSIYGRTLALSRSSPYPSLEELLLSISGSKIKELHIPADMYDITPKIVRMIGSKLSSLEHLSWGFDYTSTVSNITTRQTSPCQTVLTICYR